MASAEASAASDAALVLRARRGDPDALQALVRRHYRAAYAVGLAMLGNGMDAEDVCQDAFVRALERLEDCRDPEKFTAWLLQIVRNRARNHRAYLRVREPASPEPQWIAAPDDPARDLERGELRAVLEKALASLTDMQRQVVLLHDLEGLPHRTIGETLGISELMSRQHLFVARRRLRERLGRQANAGRQAGRANGE
jgi:RNA polymerase sigma-70 factor (ECF subfamily)